MSMTEIPSRNTTQTLILTALPGDTLTLIIKVEEPPPVAVVPVPVCPHCGHAKAT